MNTEQFSKKQKNLFIIILTCSEHYILNGFILKENMFLENYKHYFVFQPAM